MADIELYALLSSAQSAAKEAMNPNDLDFRLLRSFLVVPQCGKISTAAANHRPVRPNPLPLATVLGLTGCSYVLDPAVSERPAPPARSPDRYQNHASLRPRRLPYVDAYGQLPDRYRRQRRAGVRRWSAHLAFIFITNRNRHEIPGSVADYTRSCYPRNCDRSAEPHSVALYSHARAGLPSLRDAAKETQKDRVLPKR